VQAESITDRRQIADWLCEVYDRLDLRMTLAGAPRRHGSARSRASSESIRRYPDRPPRIATSVEAPTLLGQEDDTMSGDAAARSMSPARSELAPVEPAVARAEAAVRGRTMGEPRPIQTGVTTKVEPRHSAIVRATHWITALCFLAMLVTGALILTSHPRLYWGETGNTHMEPLLKLPIPASRGGLNTGYDFTLKDRNSWGRSLHFQTGWLLVGVGLLYGLHGLLTGHFRKNLLPARTARPGSAESYNPVQRLAYLGVIFGLFPLMIWTGLAMSPAFVARFPIAVEVFGGQQSARTIHFVVTVLLLLFIAGHIVMVARAGFVARIAAMVTGRVKGQAAVTKTEVA
jgi:thiosulfate reductase cytochrome b subunit